MKFRCRMFFAMCQNSLCHTRGGQVRPVVALAVGGTLGAELVI